VKGIAPSHAPALPEQAKTWKFIEFWVDPVLFPPKILMLVGHQDGTCRIFNPASDYKLVVTHSNYEAAQAWGTGSVRWDESLETPTMQGL
jgi:hypothetical protein